MKLSAYNIKGVKLADWTLKPADLGEPNDSLLAQALRIYQVNSHQNTSRVKTRGEVVGSTRKIYPQKGSGNARHGSRYAPIFVGGGVAHGPKGIRAQALSLPKKMRRLALKSALAYKLKETALAGLINPDEITGKTSATTSLFAKIANHPKNKTLVIIHNNNDKLYRSLSNLQRITLKRDNLVNAFDLVSADFVVVTKESLAALVARANNKLIADKK